MTTAVATPRIGIREYKEFLKRPENAGRRFELVRGNVVEMPSPTRFHGTVCFLIAHLLGLYLFKRGSGSIATNDSGLVVESDPDTIRGPDVMVFLEKATLDDIPRGPSEDVPSLVVEVLSPSDRHGRLLKRIEQYHRRGVPLVWVVEPEDRVVTVYRQNELPKVLDEVDELSGNGILPDFSCKVADLFTLPGQLPAAVQP